MAREIDVGFPGERIRRPQADIGSLKERHLRLDRGVAALRADMSRVEGLVETFDRRMDGLGHEIDRRFDAVNRRVELTDGRFDEMRTEMTRNPEIAPAAIDGLKRGG